VTDPQGSYADLNWGHTQATSDTDLTTASSNGAYYHAWTYGYFEVSMAFNANTGNWPAIWMRPVSAAGGGSANGGELDLFEWQSQSPSTGFSTVHVWQNGTDIANNNSSNAWTIPAGTNLSNYNTYGVLWTPTKISWYLNNVLVNTVSTTSGPYATAFGKQQSYFLILSEQAGCNWTYALDAPCKGQANPIDMKIKWVHVFQPPQ
jgi:beta-glucanase (GH16 family)